MCFAELAGRLWHRRFAIRRHILELVAEAGQRPTKSMDSHRIHWRNPRKFRSLSKLLFRLTSMIVSNEDPIRSLERRQDHLQLPIRNTSLGAWMIRKGDLKWMEATSDGAVAAAAARRTCVWRVSSSNPPWLHVGHSTADSPSPTHFYRPCPVSPIHQCNHACMARPGQKHAAQSVDGACCPPKERLVWLVISTA